MSSVDSWLSLASGHSGVAGMSLVDSWLSLAFHPILEHCFFVYALCCHRGGSSTARLRQVFNRRRVERWFLYWVWLLGASGGRPTWLCRGRRFAEDSSESGRS